MNCSKADVTSNGKDERGDFFLTEDDLDIPFGPFDDIPVEKPTRHAALGREIKAHVDGPRGSD